MIFKSLDVEENDEFLCMSYDEDDCRYRFVYNETVDNDKKVIVHVSRSL